MMGVMENRHKPGERAYHKELTLTERLEIFYKKPIDEIFVESTQEVDVGDPMGNEVW